MTPFLIHPLDPLVFGSGRPFTAVPGSRVDSFELPPPSTLAGMVRTALGKDAQGVFDRGRISELLEIGVLGPLLALEGEGPELALPAPADALRLSAPKGQTGHRIRRLVPLELGTGDAVSSDSLLPVGMHAPDRNKAPRSAPRYWRTQEILRWLTNPVDDRPVDKSFGVTAPNEERRIHVRVGPDGTADDGGLFGTTGRRFFGYADGAQVQLALYGEVDATLPDAFHAVLGGEGRLSRVEHCGSLLPDIPEAVVASARAGFVRAYLLTPAPLGGSGWSPEGARVVAQASGRPDVISGWAYKAPTDWGAGYPAAKDRGPQGGMPKPTRRLVPAGSVFFLELQGTPDEREAFVRARWTRSIVTGQDARDGFGRVLFGVWDGQTHPLSIIIEV